MQAFSEHDDRLSTEFGHQARLMYPDRTWAEVVPMLDAIWHQEPHNLPWVDAQARMHDAFDVG